MSKDTVVTTEIERARRDWMSEHLQSYLRSGGARGHIVDLRPIGGHAFTTTLLLRTKGRKSGQTRTAPLIYGSIGGEVVVVASKGGADVHPAWYHNIKGGTETFFTDRWRAFPPLWAGAEGGGGGRGGGFKEKSVPAVPRLS